MNFQQQNTGLNFWRQSNNRDQFSIQAEAIRKQKIHAYETVKTLDMWSQKDNDLWQMGSKQDKPWVCPCLLSCDSLLATVEDTGTQAKPNLFVELKKKNGSVEKPSLLDCTEQSTTSKSPQRKNSMDLQRVILESSVR